MLLALPIGILIGLSLGALGGGGSILTVPALVYLLGESPHGATTAHRPQRIARRLLRAHGGRGGHDAVPSALRRRGAGAGPGRAVGSRARFR